MMVALVFTFTVFNFLSSLSNEIEDVTIKSSKISVITDQIRISAVSIIKSQRKILIKKATAKDIELTLSRIESFISQLDEIDSLYRDPEVNKFVERMKDHLDYLKSILSKSAQGNIRGGEDQLGLGEIEISSDKILETFSDFQEIQLTQSQKRNQKFKEIIKETKRNMMITLIIGFLGTIILSLVVPGKIALPFKKIKDAIRELQECNFDVSIYYSQDDEIGDIAREMNKMIQSFKLFDELRTDRIGVENRKFDALANMVKKPILVANAEGRLVYMNNRLFSLLQVQSEDVLGKEMSDTQIPKTIIESYELAIKRRSKIENAIIEIPAKHFDGEEGPEEAKLAKNGNGNGNGNGESHEEKTEVHIEGEEETTKEKEPDLIFSGYANIIPIRGKERSLDYYLMVLSEEVFA